MTNNTAFMSKPLAEWNEWERAGLLRLMQDVQRPPPPARDLNDPTLRAWPYEPDKQPRGHDWLRLLMFHEPIGWEQHRAARSPRTEAEDWKDYIIRQATGFAIQIAKREKWVNAWTYEQRLDAIRDELMLNVPTDVLMDIDALEAWFSYSKVKATLRRTYGHEGKKRLIQVPFSDVLPYQAEDDDTPEADKLDAAFSQYVDDSDSEEGYQLGNRMIHVEDVEGVADLVNSGLDPELLKVLAAAVDDEGHIRTERDASAIKGMAKTTYHRKLAKARKLAKNIIDNK